MERAHRLRIHAKTTVFAVVAAQLVAGVALAAAIAYWGALGGGAKAAYSALTGTLAGVLPNFYLALKMFSVPADTPPDRLLRAIYVGETLKIVFAGSMLAAAMVVLDVSVPYLLVGYLATVVVQWFAFLLPVSDGTR